MPQAADTPPLAQRRDFWVVIGYALALGVVGAFAALVFVGVTEAGEKWYSAPDPGWFGGHWWWLAVTGGGGLAVAGLRRWTRLPEKIPGMVDDLVSGQVDWKLVPAVALVSAVSLICGASLGPEKALGCIGGGAASWMSERAGLDDEDAGVNTRAGFAGAYGGLFSSTVIVVMLIMEIARPGGRRFAKTLATAIVSASVSFGIYSVIAGAVFLGIYRVPKFAFADWELGAGVLLGLYAAVVTSLLGIVVAALTRFAARLPTLARPVAGGLAFGVIGVILPLTMMTGSVQLATVLRHAGTLGVALIAVTLVAKMVTFGIGEATGFVGGPIFPAMFIGGTAGVLAHVLIPGLPLGLAVACLLAAVPGSLIAAPFSTVLLAAFLTQVGALQTGAVLIAVITAFLAVEGVKYVAARRHAR
jgi:H+/Cl- antiporter ClcA